MPPADSLNPDMSDEEFDSLSSAEQREVMRQRHINAERALAEEPRPGGLHPSFAFHTALPMRTLERRAEMAYWKANPNGRSGEWEYRGDQFLLKTWLSEYHEYGDVPPDLKESFELAMKSEELLDAWKESRDPTVWGELQNKDQELRKEEKRLLLKELKESNPLLAASIEANDQSQSLKLAQDMVNKILSGHEADTQWLQNAQEILGDPVLQTYIDTRNRIFEQVSGGGHPGAPQAGDPTPAQRDSTTPQAVEPAPPRRGSTTTGIERSLPGLRGFFNASGRGSQGRSGAVPQGALQAVEPAPSQRDSATAITRGGESSAGSVTRRDGETPEEWRERLKERLADNPIYQQSLARRRQREEDNKRESGMGR
jgi:hypothetical protein